MKYARPILAIYTGLTIFFASCANPRSSDSKSLPELDQNPIVPILNDTVTLTIDSTKSKKNFQDLFFYYHDSLYQSQGIGIKFNSVSFSLKTPVILIDAVNNQTPYFIKPGENIKIRNAGTDSLSMYMPGNVERSNELNFFRKMVNLTGNIWYFVPDRFYHGKADSEFKIHQLERQIDSVKINRLNFLAEFSKQYKMSKDFVNTATKCIKVTAISDSIYLYRRNKDWLGKKNLYISLISAKVNSVEQVGFMHNQFYYRTCSDLVEILSSKATNKSAFESSFNFVNTNFRGLTKDFLLARLVYADFKSKIPISKNILREFYANCKDPAYRNQIHEILTENSITVQAKKGSNSLLSLDGKTIQDLYAVMKKHRGKLVIFDFWASWCGPCRSEMPSSAKLKTDYKGKNVVFVTISTDGNILDWKKAAKEETLESDNEFLLLNADQAPFMKQYAINSIPRYILFGKNGKVINDNAPRPSDPKLKVLLDRSL